MASRRVRAAAPLRLAALDCATSRPPPAVGRGWQKPVSLRKDVFWSRQRGPPHWLVNQKWCQKWTLPVAEIIYSPIGLLCDYLPPSVEAAYRRYCLFWT